jgi:hypothetical protein
MGQFRQCTMNYRQRIALCYCQAGYRFVPDHSEKEFGELDKFGEQASR